MGRQQDWTFHISLRGVDPLRWILFFIGMGFTIYLLYAFFSGFFQYTEPGVFAGTVMWIAGAFHYSDPEKIGNLVEILAFVVGFGMILLGLGGDE